MRLWFTRRRRATSYAVTMTRVIVIGGGIIGCCIADALAPAGIDVEVLERDQLAAGSSGLAVGVVESQYTDPLWIDLRVFARRAFDQLATDSEIGFVRSGYARLGYSDDDIALFTASVDHQRSLGVEDARVLAVDELAPGSAHFIGVARLPDGLVLIHDLDRFLSTDESRRLDAALEAAT